MKSRLLLLLTALPALLFFSCKKADVVNNSAYYMKADIEGTMNIFSIDAKAISSHGDFTNTLTMSATAKDPAYPYGKNIQLQILQINTPVVPGVYTQASGNGTHPVNGYYYLGGDLTFQEYFAGTNTNASRQLKLTIASITSATVTGTFEGEYFDSRSGQDSVLITNGEFYLPVE